MCESNKGVGRGNSQSMGSEFYIYRRGIDLICFIKASHNRDPKDNAQFSAGL